VAEVVPVQGLWGLLQVWAAYATFVYVVLTGLSTLCFIYYYVYPTYDKWRFKSNPKYPSPTYVMGEFFLGGLLGPPTVTLAPAIHLYLIANGTFRHHCDTPLTWQYRLFSAVVVIVITDFYEWAWHYCGHWLDRLWVVHKHHHKYYNPTPFGTIADYPFDNIMRSLYPIIDYSVAFCVVGLPLDVDIVYIAAGIINMGWGMYLHCGHELAAIPYDHPFLNTSFQHYAHHAVSVKNKPYHTGFFVKAWDQLAGSIYQGEQVIPALEDQKLGNRSRERWESEVKPSLPDYTLLASPHYWLQNWRNAPGLHF
jgi:sterol desaturase/sphingolipid hydroxylase (fatty acid hydroxylase superfamily)